MTELQPHQQRVVEEEADLAWKVLKLGQFIDAPLFDTVPKSDQVLLIEQRVHMTGYLAILRQRIATF